jgi:opacity protein-like surface antigen
LDGQGRPHDYQGVDFTGKRTDIIDQLENYFDQRGGLDFETQARVRGRRNNFNESDGKRNRQWVHGMNLGAGVERRLGDVVTINAEFRYTTLWNDDWIDGVAIGLRKCIHS